MSTAIQEKSRGFKKAQAEEMPRLANIGYVSVVNDAKISAGGTTDDGEEKPNYVMNLVEITGISGSRSTKFNWMYRPEWLNHDFDPNRGFEGLPESVQRSLSFVYKRNIGQNGEVAALEGFTRSEDEGNELASLLVDIDTTDAEAVTEVLRSYLVGEERTIGYYLKQKSTKTNEINPETGKTVYVREKQYEVDSFFHPTKKEIARLVKQAEKSGGKFKIAFDPDLPF